MDYFTSNIPNELNDSQFSKHKREYTNYILNTATGDLNTPHQDRMIALMACSDICHNFDSETDPRAAEFHAKLDKVFTLHKISEKDALFSF